ncbi:MAG: hypothetical protein ACYC6V_02830 [Bacillota bacterium]
MALIGGSPVPKALQPITDRIQPRGVAVFGGVLRPERLNWFEKWILKNVKAPLGDYRDWNAIASWAGSIAQRIKEPDRAEK